jgi:hypothetical protein
MIDLGITEMASYFVQTERSFGDEKIEKIVDDLQNLG